MPAVGPVLAAGPKLVVERPSISVGEVIRGEVREARFALRNGGDQPLRILRVNPG